MSEQPIIKTGTFRPFASSSNTDFVYQTIKNLEESNFPLPTPTATIDVGTFNARFGTFNGLTSTLETIDEEPTNNDPSQPQRKPVRVPVPPEVSVNAVNVILTFEVINSQGPLSVTVNHVNVTAPAGQNSISINVGKESLISWTLSSGHSVYRDQLILKRPAIIGVGAFTIPALPIAIIYAPPQGLLAQNHVDYSHISSVGTTYKMSFNTANTVTHSDFDTLDAIQEAASQIVDAIGDDLGPLKIYAQAAVFGLKLFITAVGEVHTSTADGIQTTQEHTLAIVDSRTEQFSTEQGLGPGVGDRIIFFRNAQVAWLIDDKGLHLALLSHSDEAIYSVREMQKDAQELSPGSDTVGTITGLTYDVLQALLNLDPLVADPQVDLLDPQLAGRFTLPNGTSEQEGSGTGDASHPDTLTFTHTVQSEDVNTLVNTRTVTVDHRQGWLGFLGIGEPSNEIEQTTSTNSSSTGSDNLETLTISLNIVTQGDERYDVVAYYDRIFGTFAFQSVTQGARKLSGVVRDEFGRPLAQQEVIAQMGKKKLATRTDARGEYVFNSSSIVPGPLTLVAGSTSKFVHYQGTPLAIDLQKVHLP